MVKTISTEKNYDRWIKSRENIEDARFHFGKCVKCGCKFEKKFRDTFYCSKCESNKTDLHKTSY